jgi:hypothetical protein
MTKNWTEKFSTALLASSQEDQDTSLALREWKFTGSLTDHGKPIAQCGLCGHSGLRYHFMIANQLSGEVLWVGSQCILHFDLQASKIGIKPSSEIHKNKQERKNQIDAARFTELLIPVQQLYFQVGKSDQRKIHWVVGKFQRRGGFSPKDLAWLFQAMMLVEINFQSKDYPLTLKTKQDQQELSQLSLTAREMIKPCLEKSKKS